MYHIVGMPVLFPLPRCPPIIGLGICVEMFVCCSAWLGPRISISRRWKEWERETEGVSRSLPDKQEDNPACQPGSVSQSHHSHILSCLGPALTGSPESTVHSFSFNYNQNTIEIKFTQWFWFRRKKDTYWGHCAWLWSSIFFIFYECILRMSDK